MINFLRLYFSYVKFASLSMAGAALLFVYYSVVASTIRSESPYVIVLVCFSIPLLGLVFGTFLFYSAAVKRTYLFFLKETFHLQKAVKPSKKEDIDHIIE